MKLRLFIVGLFFVPLVGYLCLKARAQSVPVTFSINIPKTKLFLSGSIITPAGNDLIKVITGPTTFALSSFPKDSRVSLFIINDGTNAMVWLSNQRLIIIGGHMPTNQTRAAVVFEEVNGEIWAAPSTP